jgi:hypothetical protein
MATVKPDPSNGGTVGAASGSPAALAVPAPPDRGRPGRGDGEEGSMTSAITATGLRKSFGGTAVLDGIDLEVGAGTTFSLLGSNGAGKTTVQIMSTLVHADGGEVRVAGHDVARHPAAVRAAIGVTGQFSAAGNLLTGEENLLRSSPGWSGPPPPPCSGPIAISVSSYAAAGNGPGSGSPAGCASRAARFPHTASPAWGAASHFGLFGVAAAPMASKGVNGG